MINATSEQKIRHNGFTIYREVQEDGPFYDLTLRAKNLGLIAVEMRKQSPDLVYVFRQDMKSELNKGYLRTTLGALAVDCFREQFHLETSHSMRSKMKVEIGGWQAIRNYGRTAVAAVLSENSTAGIFREREEIDSIIRGMCDYQDGNIIPARDTPHITAFYLSQSRPISFEDSTEPYLALANDTLPPGEKITLSPLKLMIPTF